jgi:hypothetical protein
MLGEITQERIHLDGMHDCKKFFKNSTRRWEDNIKMDLGKIPCEGLAWIRPTQHVDTVM